MTYIIRKNNYTAIESINGKRVWFATKTPNKRLAEKRAKAYFQALREENLAAAEKLMNRNPSSITISDLLDLYEKLATVKADTRTKNIAKLKLILKETETPLTSQVNALTGRIISRFERQRHKAAKDVPSLHTAKRTVAATVRQARSVFAKRMLQLYADEGFNIDVSDFTSRSVEQGPSVRYKAPKDGLAAKTLAASKKLREDDPEAYKAFICEYFAGMRKNEVAHAKVSWLGDHSIHIQPDGDFDTKNSYDREVYLAPDIWATLMELVGDQTDYILKGTKTERTDKVFRRLNAWLTDQGWTHTNKRGHELRKVYGSTVSKIAGIQAAQQLLGHMDIKTTDRFYSDIQAKVVVNE